MTVYAELLVWGTLCLSISVLVGMGAAQVVKRYARPR